jgi:4-amino-4-deoxy-L-arabinose transferase-like glycosyltransferase
MTSENAVPSQQHPQSKTWHGDKVFYGIVALALIFGILYNLAILIGFGPDEVRHINYVKLLWEERRLPFQIPDASVMGGYREHHDAHSFHPPLYYFLFVPFYALLQGMSGDSEWNILRLISLILCAGALPLIYDLAYVAGKKSQWFARLATAHVALLPMFGMTAATVNNDSATFFAVTLFLWLLVIKYSQGLNKRAILMLGLCMGLGALCKATALLCDGIALLVYLWLQHGKIFWRTSSAWRPLLATVAIAAIIIAPWHIRSFMLYGTWTPLPPAMPSPALPAPSNGKLVMMLHPNFLQHLLWAIWGLFYSYWSQRDWILQRANEVSHAGDSLTSVQFGVFLVFAIYCGLSLMGLLRGWITKKESSPTQPFDFQARAATWCSVLGFVAAWITVLQVALFMHWGWAEGGRYLLPAAAGFAIALAHGWRTLVGENGLKLITTLWCLGLIALNGICVYWLHAYLNPTFGSR